MADSSSTIVRQEPHVNWRCYRACQTFYDRDGSTWQVQTDPETGELFPALILSAPKPCRLFTGHIPNQHRHGR